MRESELIAQTEKTFEDIKHVDEDGNEYWCERELQLALQYSEWRKFERCRSSQVFIVMLKFFLQLLFKYAIIHK